MKLFKKGDKFNFWTVVEKKEDGKWLCECICGNLQLLNGYNLINHRSSKVRRSCGCRKGLSKGMREKLQNLRDPLIDIEYTVHKPIIHVDLGRTSDQWQEVKEMAKHNDIKQYAVA